MERPTGVVEFTPDPTLFPFESRWFASSVGPVHYIDEGAGPTLLLLHGNPDWSFLYRKIVSGLRDDFRCIAPDSGACQRLNHRPLAHTVPRRHVHRPARGGPLHPRGRP